MTSHPYASLPKKCFWSPGVAEKGLLGLEDLWTSRWILPSDLRVATYGSCFAQHVSRALVARGMNWTEAELGPRALPDSLAQAYNYGVFSARTGNIYTARQLLAWAQMAAARPRDAVPEPEFWPEGDGVRDSLRPAIEPRPFVSLREATESRAEAVRAFRRSIATSDVLLFTMGLTEGWENRETGLPYAMCPGTLAGTFDPDLHVARSYGFVEMLGQFEAAFALLRRVNPELKIILTVSPVSPVATHSGQHILVAGMHTKSLLRAVASELALGHDFVDYFPSYEMMASPAARGMFYGPNLRTIAPQGVEFVMGHFLNGLRANGPPIHGDAAAPAPAVPATAPAADLACEEAVLAVYANGAA